MLLLIGRRWISVLVLIALLSGCASSRVSVLPGSQVMSESETGEPHILAIGDQAFVVLVDGSEAEGEVVQLSPNFVVLGRTGNYGYDETLIASQNIECIVWVNSGSIWPYLGAVGVVLAVWSVNQLSHID